MKHAIKSMVFALVFSVLSASNADANLVLIVTDQSSAAKANEVIALFKKTPPFSRMSALRYKIVKTTTATLGCSSSVASKRIDFLADHLHANDRSHEELLAHSESRDRLARIQMSDGKSRVPPSCQTKNQPDRLLRCDTPTALTYLGKQKANHGARYVVVVKDDARYGGSGGTYPVITTGSPAAMAIHELMHQMGFADEYEYYTACEADTYCDVQAGNQVSPSGYGNLPGSSFNIALFNSRASYSSSADARARHGSLIPWIKSIESTQIVTSGKLGSPNKAMLGVHRAITCNKASRYMETWQPDGRNTIMKSLGTNYIPIVYWDTLAKSLGTKLGHPIGPEVVY